jgi:hypothetical protein
VTLVNDDSNVAKRRDAKVDRGFVTKLFAGLVRDAVNVIIAFCVGTGAGAIVCWYYGIPLVFSLIGGILVLGLAVAFWSEGLFS